VDEIGRHIELKIGLQRLRSHRSGHRLMFLRMPGVNRQGQAHMVFTAIVSPGSGKGAWEAEATPWFRTWFSIDPQPASISPTINVSIVFSVTSLLIVAGPFAIVDQKRLHRDLARFVAESGGYKAPQSQKVKAPAAARL
jgi:hypothetical protein